MISLFRRWMGAPADVLPVNDKATIARLGEEIARQRAMRAEVDADRNRLEALVAELTAAKMDLARQLAQACRERDECSAAAENAFERGWMERLSQEQQNNRLSLEEATRLARWGKALNDIAAQETPNANGTVKRMARMAREALE